MTATSNTSPIHLRRSSGILLHVSSLPGPFGIGDLGPEAYRFADLLAETGQRVWQVLPLVPVGHGSSPYSSPSTFAGNPLFISPHRLAEQGLLDPLRDEPELPKDRVDFAAVSALKYRLLENAFTRFESDGSHEDQREFEEFCAENSYWLDDYALFMALKSAFGERSWTSWPHEIATREASAVDRGREEQARPIRQHKFYQYLFATQWQSLKTYCNDRDVSLFGDLPIYVAHDSADVWAHRDLFYLDEHGQSTVVSGVPPDYFSETGQRWGNPIYRWDRMRENGFAWWTRRFENIFKRVDLIRLDHFRGFAAYWEIPASEETAVRGRWVDGPGAALFEAVEERLGPLPLVAENLGLITDDVTELMEQFGFPGMAVLQFAFGEGADHPFLPHNLGRNVVAYTGTHDNDTMAGWWTHVQQHPNHSRTARFGRRYLRLDERIEDVHWAAVRSLMASHADIVVTPLQDLLGLGSEARMNTPGESDGNWDWRYVWDSITPELREQLKTLTAMYGRSGKLEEVLHS